MSSTDTVSGIGWRVFGLGLIAMALVWLKWGDFSPGQPVPALINGGHLAAYLAAAFTLAAGLAIEWRRSAPWGAAAIVIYYVVGVVLIADGPGFIEGYSEYGSYSNVAEQLAIATGALPIYAAFARLPASRAARLTRIAQLTFGVCAVLFGGAHFFYLSLTVPLIPKWLPPSQLFWAYATGIAQIAAGLAILTGIKARLAAVLLTAMYIVFGLLVHIPIVVANPSNYFAWTENALNLALIGVAWVMADSLPRLKA